MGSQSDIPLPVENITSKDQDSSNAVWSFDPNDVEDHASDSNAKETVKADLNDLCAEDCKEKLKLLKLHEDSQVHPDN